MNAKRIIEMITKDAKRLHFLIKQINSVWPSAQLQIIEVMLQNMASYCPEAVNWNDDLRLKEIDKIVKALRAFEQYNSYHVTQFVADEADSIVSMAYTIASEEEDERQALKESMLFGGYQ